MGIINKLLKEHNGRKISCTIHNKKVKEAEIYYHRGKFSILQNIQAGGGILRSDYRCSWSAGDGKPDTLYNVSLSNIEFIDSGPIHKIHELWI